MPIFKSKYWCPNISQVIALTIIWENENNYLVSTAHLVSRVIKHLTKSKSHGTLIVPHWPSAASWLFLRNRFANTFQDFVTDFIKKATLPQVFSCEFCKIYKNTFSYRTPPVADSEYVTNYTKRVTIHKLRGFWPSFLKLFTVLWTFQENFIQSREADVYRKTIGYTIGLCLILSNK